MEIDKAMQYQIGSVKVMKSLRQRPKAGVLFPPIESPLSKLQTFLSSFKYKAVPGFSDSSVR